MGNGMRRMQGTWGMFTKIPGNLLENSRECSHFSIPGNSRKDFGECSRRFRGMFKNIPGNVQEDFGEYSRGFRGMLLKILGNVPEDSGECSSGFWGMLKKIPGNLNFDLFLEILLVFYQILLLNCYETMEKNNYWSILLNKTFSSLRLITIFLRLITISLT